MDMSCKWKKAIVVSWEKLCVDYKDTAAAYNAASEHKMEHLKRALKTNLMYLTYIAKKVFKFEFDVDATKVEAKHIIENTCSCRPPRFLQQDWQPTTTR